MTKYSLVILVAMIFQAICGTIARPENQHLSENQIIKLKEVASQWKELINSEKKPCDDFYGYVCSKKDFPDTHDYSMKFLQRKIEPTTETEEKFIKFSTQCEEIKEEEKDEFIRSFKLDSIGSWPAFEENWNVSKFNLPLAVAEMTSYDYPVIIHQEFSNTLETEYQISKQKLIDIDEVLLKTKFESLGVKNLEEVIADAVLFEKNIKEAEESVKSDSDLRIKFTELKDHCPEVDWDKQIEVIFGGKLPDDYTVLLKSHETLKSIYSAVSKMSPKVIANYFFTSFVLNIHTLEQTPAHVLFLPIIHENALKNLDNENRQDILKNLYLTLVEVLSQIYDFETNKISEDLIKYINEDIFRSPNEQDIAKDFKEVTCDNGCMKNYHLLVKLQNKRYSKHFFTTKNALINEMKGNLISHFFYAASSLNDEPLLFKFESLMLSIVPAVLSPFMKEGIFSTSQKECFSKQLNKESLSDDDMTLILGAHIILKVFGEWSKDYQHIIEEENKIYQEYGLSFEQLLLVSLGKHFCERPDTFNLLKGAFSSAVHCPAGSKWNTDSGCTFFPPPQ